MKIMIDLTSLAHNFSGIERYAACQTLEMIKEEKNHYILLFKGGIHPLFEKVQHRTNVTIKVLKTCNKLWFNQIKLPIAIYGIQADCYLFLAFPVPIFLFKKNMVSAIHDIGCWDVPDTMTLLGRIYFKISFIVSVIKCKKIITVSEFSKTRIINKLHCNVDKIACVYNGVDQTFYNYHNNEIKLAECQKKYSLPRKYILSLSTLEPRKNLQLLVKVYQRLMDEGSIDIPLVLAGRKGWKMDGFLSGINEKIKKNIYFTGFIDEEDLPYIYGGAEVFVFPSKYEGFGLPPLEALACGCSVISSDASSLPEVLGNSVSYFKSENEDSLYHILKDFFAKPISHNQETVHNQLKKYSWEHESKKIINMLSSM